MDPRPPLTPSAFPSPSLPLPPQVARHLAFVLALPSAWNFSPTFSLCPNPSQSSKAQLGNHLLQEVPPTPLPLLSAPRPGTVLSASPSLSTQMPRELAEHAEAPSWGPRGPVHYVGSGPTVSVGLGPDLSPALWSPSAGSGGGCCDSGSGR